MQDFSTRFMRTYDAIPADVKPLPGATKLHYVDAFNSEFTLLLRERRFVSLTDMMDDAKKLKWTWQHLIKQNRKMRLEGSKKKNHNPLLHSEVQMPNLTWWWRPWKKWWTSCLQMIRIKWKIKMNLKLEMPILGGSKGLLFLKSCQGGLEIQMNNK